MHFNTRYFRKKEIESVEEYNKSIKDRRREILKTADELSSYLKIKEVKSMKRESTLKETKKNKKGKGGRLFLLSN